MFGCFSMKVTGIRDICRGEAIRAIIFMILNMDQGDEPSYALDHGSYIWKMGFETLNSMDRKHACNIIRPQMIASSNTVRISSAIVLHEADGMRNRVVGVCKPEVRSVMIHSGVTGLYILFTELQISRRQDEYVTTLDLNHT